MRRVIDVAVAAIGGAVVAPLALVVALFIRWRLGGPVLFRQRRAGRGGQEFTIVKFRTLQPEIYPGEPDRARDTRLGHLLRSSSLDEIPQLWNVLRGDMSLIGPRPTLPEQVVHYDARQRGRLSVRPGITGWAQVNGRNSISWPERIELDLHYIAHRSLWLDLQIIARTVRNLVVPSGITAVGGENPGFPLPDAHADAPHGGR